MARFRPVSKIAFKSPWSKHVNFSGTNNDLHRQDNRIIVAAQSVLLLLTTNAAIFPTPYVDLGTFTSVISEHRVNVQALGFKGNRGGHVAKTARDVSRAALLNALSSNSSYVQSVARALSPTSDIYIQSGVILSGGYAVKSRGLLNLPIVNRSLASQTTRRPEAPSAIKMILPRHPSPGQTRLRWKKPKQSAKSYDVFDYDPLTNTPGVWIQTVTSTACVISEIRGRPRSICIRANGSNGTVSGFSSGFSFFAQ